MSRKSAGLSGFLPAGKEFFQGETIALAQKLLGCVLARPADSASPEAGPFGGFLDGAFSDKGGLPEASQGIAGPPEKARLVGARPVGPQPVEPQPVAGSFGGFLDGDFSDEDGTGGDLTDSGPMARGREKRRSGLVPLLAGKIVETEAYLGLQDECCHSFKGRRTARTETMYLPAGHAYIYFIYGSYYCFNIVTGNEKEPEAVLIRALEPLQGLRGMSENRIRHRQKSFIWKKPLQQSPRQKNSHQKNPRQKPSRSGRPLSMPKQDSFGPPSSGAETRCAPLLEIRSAESVATRCRSAEIRSAEIRSATGRNLTGRNFAARGAFPPAFLTSGPGRLCQALDITADLNGAPLFSPAARSLFIFKEKKPKRKDIVSDFRVGLPLTNDHAFLPLRFYIRDNPFVSKNPRSW